MKEHVAGIWAGGNPSNLGRVGMDKDEHATLSSLDRSLGPLQRLSGSGGGPAQRGGGLKKPPRVRASPGHGAGWFGVSCRGTPPLGHPGPTWADSSGMDPQWGPAETSGSETQEAVMSPPAPHYTGARPSLRRGPELSTHPALPFLPAVSVGEAATGGQRGEEGMGLEAPGRYSCWGGGGQGQGAGPRMPVSSGETPLLGSGGEAPAGGTMAPHFVEGSFCLSCPHSCTKGLRLRPARRGPSRPQHQMPPQRTTGA